MDTETMQPSSHSKPSKSRWRTKMLHVHTDAKENNDFTTPKSKDISSSDGKRRLWSLKSKKKPLSTQPSPMLSNKNSYSSSKARLFSVDSSKSFETNQTESTSEETQISTTAPSSMEELQKKCEHYQKMTKNLTQDLFSLQYQLTTEQASHKQGIEQMKQEVEAANQKVSVLESHFHSLNEQQNEESYLASKSQEKDSIVQLDSAYFNDLKTSVSEKSNRLEQLEEEFGELKRSSEATEFDLRLEIEDMNNKLEAREATIKSLEESNNKMRESLFKPKPSPYVPRHMSMRDVDCDDGSVVSLLSPIPSKRILDCATPVPQTESNEYSVKLEEMKRHLQERDHLVYKLKTKLEKKSALLHEYRRERKAFISAEREDKLELSDNIKILIVMNKMMNSSIQKLENLKKYNGLLSTLESESDSATPDTNILKNETQRDEHMLPDVTKITDVEENLYAFMKKLGFSMKNSLQDINVKLRSNFIENCDDDESVSGERKPFNESPTPKDIENINDEILQTLCETESELSKRIEEITANKR